MKNTIYTAIAAALITGALASPALAADDLDQYGCRVESTGKYHCFSGNQSGKIFNSQADMLATGAGPINNNIVPPANVNSNPSLNNNVIPPASINSNPSLNNNAIPPASATGATPLSNVNGAGQATRQPVTH